MRPNDPILTRLLTTLTENMNVARLYRDVPIRCTLSGGYDSTTLLAIAAREYGAKNVRAITFSGPKTTSDEARAVFTAKHFGVPITVYRWTANDILQFAKEHPSFAFPVRTVFALQYATSFRMYYETVRNDEPFDILNGGGADALYGTNWRVYVQSGARAKREGISLDEARTRDKIDDFVKRKAHDNEGRLWNEMTRAAGKNPIRPFSNANTEWVVEIPCSVVDPTKKELAHNLCKHMLNVNMSAVQRMNMQEGTGIYHALKSALCEAYGTKSANLAVRKLVSLGA